jgi:hypothetical protein
MVCFCAVFFELWRHASWICALFAQVAAVGSVRIELPATDAAWARDALDGCNEALGTERCQISEAGNATDAGWFVSVEWQDASRLRARITLRPPAGHAVAVATREVAFSPADDLEKRYRAVGVIIAAHVIARVSTPETVPAEPQPSPVEQAAPDAAVGRVVWGLDLGLRMGPGLDRGAPRYGALLRAWLRPTGAPWAMLASLRGSHRFENPALSWLSASAGLRWDLAPMAWPVQLEWRTELALQRFQASARDPDSGARASAGAWRWGPMLGLEAVRLLGGGLGLFGGLEASYLRPSLRVEVRGREVGKESALRWAGLLGLRWTP